MECPQMAKRQGKAPVEVSQQSEDQLKVQQQKRQEAENYYMGLLDSQETRTRQVDPLKSSWAQATGSRGWR